MSAGNGNGKAPDLASLKEQARTERALARLAQARHERQLWESLGTPSGGFGYGWGDLLNPYGYRRDDLGRVWLPLNQGGPSSKRDGRNEPFVQTDSDLDAIRGLAYWLTTKNDLAIGALSLLRNYTVKEGYDYDALPAAGYEDDGRANDLARQVQRVIDRDSDLNNLPERECSAFERGVRDGDAIVRHFAQYDGTTRHRFVRAEQLRDPGNQGPHATFGKECDPDDVETALAYWITYDGGSSYQRVPAEQISHHKRNVDSEIKRGLSDFFSVGEALDEVSKLLRGMRRGATLLSKIAWIEEMANATGDQLRSHQSDLRDQSAPQVDNPVTGRRTEYQTMQDGTVVRTNNKKYQPPPLAGNTANFVSVVQAALRSAGVRWCMAEYMSSGFMGNVAELSILAAGSPFVKNVECDQARWGRYFLRWRWVAVRNACRAGLIRATLEEVEALVDVHFVAPQVAVANELEQAQVDWGDMDRGVLSVPGRRSRRNLDNEQERKHLAEEPMTRTPGKVSDIDAAGDPVAAPASGNQ